MEEQLPLIVLAGQEEWDDLCRRSLLPRQLFGRLGDGAGSVSDECVRFERVPWVKLSSSDGIRDDYERTREFVDSLLGRWAVHLVVVPLLPDGTNKADTSVLETALQRQTAVAETILKAAPHRAKEIRFVLVVVCEGPLDESAVESLNRLQETDGVFRT